MPANDNASTRNISGMTPREVVEQERLVSSLSAAMEALEASGELFEWELDR